MEVNKEELEVVKQAIHTKLWRKDENQLKKWKTFLSNLCKLHNKSPPGLVVNENVKTPHLMSSTIFLNKFSVISFLHEFGHFKGMTDELEVKQYSEELFLNAYPKAMEYLKIDERGYLVKKNGGK